MNGPHRAAPAPPEGLGTPPARPNRGRRTIGVAIGDADAAARVFAAALAIEPPPGTHIEQRMEFCSRVVEAFARTLDTDLISSTD